MLKVSAIIPAAGIGIRLKSKVAKPYIRLNNKPLFWYCLNVLSLSNKIRDIIVVVEGAQVNRVKNLIRRFRIRKVKAVVAGGKTRSESVSKGLEVVDKNTDFVLIHDGVRPFINTALIDKCIRAAVRKKAVICAVPCASTIKKVNKNLQVLSTLNRDSLWQVQTPQVFAYKLIKKAYSKFKLKKKDFYDDAALVERLPHKVQVICGENTNIKITTQDDLKLAKAIIKMGGRD